MAKQRKGKGSVDNENNNNNNSSSDPVVEQIARAKQAILQSHATTANLHTQWRQHVLRLSYMVVIITLHQWQAPITTCLHDVKSFNKSFTPLDDDTLKISGLRAIYYVLHFTMCEALGFIIGVLLSLCLYQQGKQAEATLITSTGVVPKPSFLTNTFYMVATALVPPVVNLFFTHSKEIMTAKSSCLDHSTVATVSEGMWERHDTPERGFPVVVVFHIIATACCWFMDMQQTGQYKNMQALEKLHQDLTSARKENQAKKQK